MAFRVVADRSTGSSRSKTAKLRAFFEKIVFFGAQKGFHAENGLLGSSRRLDLTGDRASGPPKFTKINRSYPVTTSCSMVSRLISIARFKPPDATLKCLPVRPN